MRFFILLLIAILSFPSKGLSQARADFYKKNASLIDDVRNHELISRTDLFNIFNFYSDDYPDSLRLFSIDVIQTGIEKNDKLYANIGKAFLGSYFNARENTDLAIQLARSSLNYFESLADYEMMVFLYNQIGNSFVRERNIREAHLAYDKAMKYAESTNDYYMNIYPLRNAAEAYYREGKYDEVMKNADFLIKNLNPKEQYSSLCIAYMLKGKTYIALNKPKEAQTYFDKAYELEKKYPSSFFKSTLLTDLGRLNYEDNPQKAKQLFEEALAASIDASVVEAIGNSIYNLGMWHWGSEDTDSAHYYFQELLDFSKNHHYENGILDAYGALSELFEEKNDYKAAYELLVEYRTVTEQLNTVNNQLEKEEIISALDLLKQEDEVIIAENNQTLFEKFYKSEKRTKIIALLAIGATLSFLLLYFLKDRDEQKSKIENEYL